MPKHHGMDDIPEKKTLNFWKKIQKTKIRKSNLPHQSVQKPEHG